jgi:hypothetical protein
MSKKSLPNQNAAAIKDPDEWTTGDEPMTGSQESYLHTLAQEAGEAPADDLTKAEASKKIEKLQEKTGRGTPRKPRRRRAPPSGRSSA